MRYPPRTRHNGDKGADVQQGPAQRFLFRLSPCVNLLYCLLLLDIPWVLNAPTGDTDIIGISPRQTNARTWNYRVKGVIQPNICYRVRIPSGVFGVTSLALYASAPNHVLVKCWVSPAPGFAALHSILSAKAAQGELL